MYGIVFLPSGRQALPCRGNWISEEKSEFESHYHQLMLVRAEDDPSVADWMEKRKFMSPMIQNEMIEVSHEPLIKYFVFWYVSASIMERRALIATKNSCGSIKNIRFDRFRPLHLESCRRLPKILKMEASLL